MSLFTSEVNPYFALCFSGTSWSGRKSLEDGVDVLVNAILKQITAVLRLLINPLDPSMPGVQNRDLHFVPSGNQN